MNRQTLEHYQVVVYLAALGLGLFVGVLLPEGAAALESFLWPVLALLLYATFTQVPLVHLRQALSDTRFVLSAAVGNFLVIPPVVWGLLQLLPGDPAIRLGVLLVLLVPCTDWFIVFSHLGGGDTRHAIAFSPLSLLLQLLFLPVYLWLFLGETFTVSLARDEMLAAFLGFILLPLLGAVATEGWVEGNPRRRVVLDRLAWFPVPLLAVVIFVIAASQVRLVAASAGMLAQVLIVFVVYLVVAGLLARLLAYLFRLPSSQGRVLAFSLGTRNSFVVLPLALALPPTFEMAAVVIVVQALVELFGMGVYLWWVPTVLFPHRTNRP